MLGYGEGDPLGEAEAADVGDAPGDAPADELGEGEGLGRSSP